DAAAVHCDIAVIPVGGKYTMTAEEAAELVNKIAPKAAIPTHYGTIVGKPSDGDLFAAGVKDGILVEKKLVFPAE
ncbi:MAG: MBL fold metallo-hydrolase, partial [Clostridia bacterium]|nr:MBL fold metallo-hydrolase [Clostridia bacterium]